MQTYENMRNIIDGQQGYSILTSEERQAVVDEIRDHSTVIELGTFQGVTAAFMARQRPTARFISVDNFSWVGDGSREGNAAAWVQNQRPNMQLFVGTLQEFASFANFGIADFIIIDGDHSYEACRKDLDAAYNLADHNAIIAVHDYQTDNPGLDGVTEAVDEFCERRKLTVYRTSRSVAFIKCRS